MENSFNRWIVLIAHTFINICLGSMYAFSVFATPLAEHFGWKMLAFSINMGILPIPMIFAGKMIDNGKGKLAIIIGGILFVSGFFLTGFVNSLPMLQLTYGLIAGFGSGICYAGTLNNGLKFFPDKKCLASGAILFGLGIGTMITSLLANHFMQEYGVLIAFRILGLNYLSALFLISFFLRSAPKEGYLPKGWIPSTQFSSNKGIEVNLNWKEMIRTPKFYLITLLFFIGALSGLMITSNASQIGQAMFGLTPVIAAIYVSLISICNSIGRLMWGTISDKLGRYNTLYLILCLITFMLIILYNANSVFLFGVGAMGVGLCFGGVASIFPGIVSDNFGVRHQSLNYSIVFIGFSVASFFGPRIAQSVAASNGNDFSKAFFLAMICSVIGIVLTFFMKKVATTSENSLLEERVS